MYPRIPWELVADPLVHAENTLETTGLSYTGGREIILKLTLGDLNHYTTQLNCFIMHKYTPLRLHMDFDFTLYFNSDITDENYHDIPHFMPQNILFRTGYDRRWLHKAWVSNSRPARLYYADTRHILKLFLCSKVNKSAVKWSAVMRPEMER
jgi:hypothetical protein